MSLLELSRINLKLLICLQALLEEESVSRTAKRLCLSQSAVSKSLSQLRELTGDPLFTRTAHGLMPTPRAEDLKRELSPLLDGLWQVIQSKEFDPANCDRHFRLSLPETASQLLFRHSMSNIIQEAPNLKIQIINLFLGNIHDLTSGKLDMVLIPHDLEFGQSAVSGLYSCTLYQDQIVCLVRNQHPCLQKEWNLDSWLELKHIGIGSVDTSPQAVDKVLARMKRQRKVVVAMEDFYSATGLCENSDLAITPPSLWTRYAQEHFQVTSLPVPLSLKPIRYVLYWHKRNHHDLAHKWLRNILIQSAKELLSGQSQPDSNSQHQSTGNPVEELDVISLSEEVS